MLKITHLYSAAAVMALSGAAILATPAIALAQQVPAEQAITRSLNQKSLQVARAQSAMHVPGVTHATGAPHVTAQDSTQHDADELSNDDSTGASSEMPQMEPDDRTIPLTPGEPGSPFDTPDPQQ